MVTSRYQTAQNRQPTPKKATTMEQGGGSELKTPGSKNNDGALLKASQPRGETRSSPLFFILSPRRESNPHLILRTDLLCPLSYEGKHGFLIA